MKVFSQIEEKINHSRKLFFVLIDPENVSDKPVEKFSNLFVTDIVDFVLVGGSLVSHPVDPVIRQIKAQTSLPVLLFPGSLLQLSGEADGILLLSLISGRNPEYLIGNQVAAAPVIKNLNLEVIPTGYILISNRNTTSVEIISNTKPLPVYRPEIIVATALAGEYMGNRMIYLERGSGADSPVPAKIVNMVKEVISVPLIVGGGIKTVGQAEELYHAGADILVVGNAIESDPGFILKMGELLDKIE